MSVKLSYTKQSTSNQLVSNQHMSFLLRLWREPQGNIPANAPTSNTKPVWRCSLTHIQTGEQYGFATLAAAMQFLEQQTEDSQGEKDEQD